MSNNSEQNGRQLSTEQAAPPTDPRTRGVRVSARVVPPTPETQRICRDFVWGICSMKDNCRYRHELEFESMRQILKFCHDHQNRTGCLRPDCTYLHTSREEQNLFLNNGVIPRVLAERYASMSTQEESQPQPAQHIMYMNEYMAAPPPPPPAATDAQPAPSAPPVHISPAMGPQMISSAMHPPQMTQMPTHGMISAPAAQPSHSQMGMPMKVTLPGAMSSMAAPLPAAMSSILAPPPPPPPIRTTAPAQVTGSIYTVSPPMQHTVTGMYQMAPVQVHQPPQQTAPQYTLPVVFDPSVPPPPIPVSMQPHTQKRPAPGEMEAGPSKAVKHDERIDGFCEGCIERNIGSELCQQHQDSLHRDEEYKRLEYEKKSEEYEKGQMLLTSLLGMYQDNEETLDFNSPMPSTSTDIFGSSSSPTYNSAGALKPLVFSVMESFVRKVMAEQQANSMESLARRTYSHSDFSRLNRVTDLQSLAAFFERLSNSASSESRLPGLESLGSNGVSRRAVGGASTLDLSAVAAGRFGALMGSPRLHAPDPLPPAPFHADPLPSVSFHTDPLPSVSFHADPLPPASFNADPLPPPAPPAYVPYPPTVQQPPGVQHQPARPFYQQPYSGTTDASYGAARGAGGAGAGGAAGSGSAPAQPYHQYMVRMPHQQNPYYRPYQ